MHPANEPDIGAPLTLAIVDDSRILSRHLKEVLEDESDLRLLRVFFNCASARGKLPELGPDVVLVDLRLPDGDGSDLIAELAPRMSGTDFVVLTVFDDDESICRAILAGATGYLLKRSGIGRIVQAIRTLRLGGAPLDHEISRRLLAFLREPADRLPAKVGLSEQESRLLRELSRGATVKEASEVIGVTYASGRTYVRRLYAKLGVHNRIEAARHCFNLANGFHAPRGPA